ncbi:small ubiquitin-related modifier [Holotrichia oblita]|uniref:Small ubiquitin-related modifier n=1 Tax=Holotrichia oblita TaxID=644536 RepID=A0ACB9TW26_HOLOL|nr:small ubiquitin-related modifier [Holotrichia oblita]
MDHGGVKCTRSVKEELQHLKSSHSSTLDPSTTTNMNKYIPMNSIDEIKTLEEVLLEEENANHLRHNLIKVGGRDAREFTFRCLTRLFTNTVGIRCAWTKLKNNFELQNLKIIAILRETTKAESEHINLKVLGQDNAVVQFKIKKHTPLRKLMSAYCDRAGLSLQVVRFRFDGNPINETDTPSSLEMEEGDTIEVFQQQTGGCYF